MRMQDLNWMDVESYLEHDDRIILTLGATEQHGYLSLFTDVLIPSRIALGIIEHDPVLIAPSLNFGVSDEFIDFPGTISISRPTFDATLTEIVESLMHQGFGGFFILNGHGGNHPPARLRDLHGDGEIRVDWYDWWRESAVREFESEIGFAVDHGNWGENFPFTRVADTPIEPKPPVNLALIDSNHPPRMVMGDGSFGGRYQIEDDLIMILFDRVVAEAVERIGALKQDS